MTNITELAQREKFEAWWEREYKHLESSKYTDAVPHIKYGFWMAYQAGGAELVEALESEKRICATWRKTAEANSEKLEKAQQQMTESENRVRKQNRHICELFDDNTALRQRIAGLEARTVKLPDLRQIVSGDRYVWSDGVYNYSQDVKVALAAAGIKVEAE